MNKKTIKCLRVIILILFCNNQLYAKQSYSNEFTRSAENFVKKYQNIKGKISCTEIGKKMSQIKKLKNKLSAEDKGHSLTSAMQNAIDKSVAIQACVKNDFKEIKENIWYHIRAFSKRDAVKCRYEKRTTSYSERIGIVGSAGLHYLYGEDIKVGIKLFCPELKEHLPTENIKIKNREEGPDASTAS